MSLTTPIDFESLTGLTVASGDSFGDDCGRSDFAEPQNARAVDSPRMIHAWKRLAEVGAPSKSRPAISFALPMV